MRKNKPEIGKIKSILRKYKLLFLVVAVVAVSGCIVPGGDVFSGMFSPQRPVTTEGSADLITTQNLNIIPNPPISAENGFTVSFEVRNNDENEEVKNVKVTQYDSGLCKSGKTDSGGGGSGESSDIVQYTDGTNVTKFSVNCGSTTETLYLDEGNTISKTVCGKKNDYKISSLDAFSFYLYIGSHFEYFKYREVRTNEGETQNCLDGKQKGGQTQCTKAYDGISYTINEVKNYDKAECIGESICVQTTCSDYCNKQNDEVAKCKARCTDPGTKDACISRCDGYTKVVGSYQAAPCWPEYRFDGGFGGECCSCVYATTGFPEGATTSTAVAGAKTYYPLQTELTEWDFTAPKNSQIGNMPRSCGIKYKISYDFAAKTQTDVTVISKSKMEEMQRAGQEPSASPQQSVGVGPLKVLFDFGAKQPVRSGDVMPVFITVEDRGSGIYGNVPAGKLKIKFPQTFEKITCDKFMSKGGGEYANAAEIPMIKKSSPQMRCSFKMPSVTDMKTFYISVILDYTYKLDDEISVAVNPTLVR